MAHVSIIGTGNMGQAIAALAAKGGNSVELIGSADTDKQVTGDVVVLAVYYPAVADVLGTRGDRYRPPAVAGAQGLQHDLRGHPRGRDRRPAAHDRPDRRGRRGRQG